MNGAISFLKVCARVSQSRFSFQRQLKCCHLEQRTRLFSVFLHSLPPFRHPSSTPSRRCSRHCRKVISRYSSCPSTSDGTVRARSLLCFCQPCFLSFWWRFRKNPRLLHHSISKRSFGLYFRFHCIIVLRVRVKDATFLPMGVTVINIPPG